MTGSDFFLCGGHPHVQKFAVESADFYYYYNKQNKGKSCVSLWLGEAVGKLCRSISGPAWLLRWAVGPITVDYQKFLHTEPIFCQILSFKAIKTRIQAHGRNRTYFLKLELYFFETILKGVPVRPGMTRASAVDFAL